MTGQCPLVLYLREKPWKCISVDAEEAGDYDVFKEALLKRFGLTAEGLRKRLRKSPPKPDEKSPRCMWIAHDNT